MRTLAHNEYWALIGCDGRPPDDCWIDHLYGDRKGALSDAGYFNRYSKKYKKDPQAPYRVARVAIIEVTAE